MKRNRLITLGLAILTVFSASSCRRREAPVIHKNSITIALTDSGLGGLSIMAEAAALLKTSGLYERVNLVFFNALFSNDSGYNSLPDREAKIRVFDSALRSLAADIRPDQILVACNTLSVLIPDTPFARTAKIPVPGIIDAGVEMFDRALRDQPDAALLLFGTETTMAEDTHRRRLVDRGISAPRIIPQACPELAGYIENEWAGENTGMLIAAYVDEALAKLPAPPPPVYAGLVCTHYGYSLNLWKKAFAERGVTLLGILNPNDRLSDVLFPPTAKKRFEKTLISARIISMVEIAANKQTSLGAWLERISPEVAAALRATELRPNLFEWKSLLK
jgi:glutamate racemase